MTPEVTFPDQDMLNQGDRDFIRDAIKLALFEHQSRWNTRLKEWGIPAIAVALAVGIGIWGLVEWKDYVTFKTRTEDTLKDIDKRLADIVLQLAASNPSKRVNQIEVKNLIENATKRHLKISVPILQNAGDSFIDAVPSHPEAWDVVVRVVNYRSENTDWQDSVLEEIKRGGYPWCFSSIPKDPGVTPSPDGKTLNFHGPVVYESCVLKIDDKAATEQTSKVRGGLIFKRCLIKYSGGQVLVPGNYQFCVFQFKAIRSPTESGLMLARSVINTPDLVN